MITDTQPTTDPATLLYLRKIKLSEQFTCRDLFVQLDVCDSEIKTLLERRVDLDAKLSAAKAGVDDAETLVALQIEGKNDAERKAHKAKALRDDPFHQAAMGELRDVEGRLARLDAEIDATKRRVRRLESQINYRTEVLHFLGG